jgi:transcriptional regulator with XRE-family HTH domain
MRGGDNQPAVQEEVGRRLRARREERRLSLRELARRLGISPSAVSQIETGKSRPSVSTLYAIVTELGMSLDELFTSSNQESDRRDERAPRDPARPVARATPDGTSEERYVQRADSRRSIELEAGVHWERLTPQADAETDFLLVTYGVGGASSEGRRFIRHSGREYGFVLEGRLEVTVGFERYELGPGDSICFDSSTPHLLRNVGPEPAKGVWIVVGRHPVGET